MRSLDVPEGPGQHWDRESLGDDVEDVVPAGRQGKGEIFQGRLAGVRTERNRDRLRVNIENTPSTPSTPSTLRTDTNIHHGNGVITLPTNWDVTRYDFHFSLFFIICNFLPPVNILFNADLQTMALTER